MACDSSTSGVADYSGPVPVIGVYIALATTVCLSLMLYDIISGFRHRKHWFPCRLFSLNSLTLTLIAIAAKIPADLTTEMPGGFDRISKVTGTLLIWSCMIFFLPSLGSMSASQSLSNVIALTILVFTVVVDICLQIKTGLVFFIYSYLIIIMFFLLSSLLDFWISSFEINNEKKIAIDRIRENLINGKGAMIQRLKWCYVRSYISNPQLLVCINQYGFFLGLSSVILALYIVALVIAEYVQLYSIEKLFSSDYKWSIPIVLATQTVLILVSTIANISRCYMFSNQIDFRTSVNYLMAKVESLEVMRMTNDRNLSHYLLLAATKIFIIVLSIRLRMSVYTLRVRTAFGKCLCFFSFSNNGAIHESKDPIDERHVKVEKWIEKKGEKDIKRWMDLQKGDVPNNLVQLLSETRPSHELFSHHVRRIGAENNWEGSDDYKVSCLSAVILVRMASDLLPSTMSQSLIHAMNEAFPIILFTDKNTMNLVSFEARRKFRFAERMWKYWDFKSQLNISTHGEIPCSIRSLLSVPLIRSQRESYFDFIRKEVGIIRNIIRLQRHTSNMDLYKDVKQLVVDLLHEFLSKFPTIVFKFVVEASPEESEDKIKHTMSLLSKLELLEDKVQWEFPCETDISCLITPVTPGSSEVDQETDAVVAATTDGVCETLEVLVCSDAVVAATTDGVCETLEVLVCSDAVAAPSATEGVGEIPEISVCIM